MPCCFFAASLRIKSATYSLLLFAKLASRVSWKRQLVSTAVSALGGSMYVAFFVFSQRPPFCCSLHRFCFSPRQNLWAHGIVPIVDDAAVKNAGDSLFDKIERNDEPFLRRD